MIFRINAARVGISGHIVYEEIKRGQQKCALDFWDRSVVRK